MSPAGAQPEGSRPGQGTDPKRRGRSQSAPDLRFAFAPELLRPKLLAWYRQGKRSLPWRVRWQEHADPFHVWVSEIMLQQTVIKAVIPVYERFLAKFPDVRALAQADEESVRQAVRGLGYYRRFRMLHAAAKVIAERGEWPTTFDGWKDLPGIGDYTAAAVSSIAFDVPAAVVDGNVERVLCRLLDLRQPPNDPKLKPLFKARAAELLDRDHPGDFNQAVMELGQLVCTVTQPACPSCPMASGCLARERGSQALAPAPKIKAQAVRDVAMRLVIVERRGLIGLFPRPEEARFLSGTAGFLTGLGTELDGWTESAAPRLAWEQNAVLGRIRHGITHHRIEASVETGDLPAGTRAPTGTRWVTPAEVEENLVANLDRKAWHVYQAMQGSLFTKRR